jgi:hypothetical protein
MKSLGIALVLCAALEAHAQEPLPRQVAAPASDITHGVVKLPDPASTPTISAAAILPLRFEQVRDGTWAADLTYPVEQNGPLTLALLSPNAANLRLFASPAGTPLAPVDRTYALERRTEIAGDSMPGWIVDRRDLHSAAAGMWNIRVESNSTSQGWLFASASKELRAQAWVTTQQLVAGSPIGIVARASGSEFQSIERARVVLEVGDQVRELALRDDGMHWDGAANDGLFGALVPEALSGEVHARIELSGTTVRRTTFLRTAQIEFPVLAPRVLLDGTATATLLDDSHLQFAIGALAIGPEMRLHVSAEVWGRDDAGEAIPVCWLSKMLAPEDRAGAWQLPLALDLDWLEVAKAAAPLELRAVRVQDPDTDVVFDLVDRIQPATPKLRARRNIAPRAITPAMLTGNASATIASLAPPQNFTSNRALMLVHGYCSSGSIWPAADFAQPKLEFLDPNANRSHDQFAQLIAQRAANAHLASFGIVAHSQGGPAALHLLTYYTSGLDFAFGGRRIQSLASPYQGTPLASWGGFACGVNNDMTPAGSATWLAGIPSWARAEVFTWTTANSGAACNAFTNLLLTDPEDGTVEKMRAELPGGNNMGHTIGWCHTTGMSNPASYTDHARNAAMNTAASR